MNMQAHYHKGKACQFSGIGGWVPAVDPVDSGYSAIPLALFEREGDHLFARNGNAEIVCIDRGCYNVVFGLKWRNELTSTRVVVLIQALINGRVLPGATASTYTRGSKYQRNVSTQIVLNRHFEKGDKLSFVWQEESKGNPKISINGAESGIMVMG